VDNKSTAGDELNSREVSVCCAQLRSRSGAWQRANGPAKHLDGIAVRIKLTQRPYFYDSGILPLLTETIFAA